jgi:hypothetical protein
MLLLAMFDLASDFYPFFTGWPVPQKQVDRGVWRVVTVLGAAEYHAAIDFSLDLEKSCRTPGWVRLVCVRKSGEHQYATS